MSSIKEFDSVRTTVAVPALFGERTIPAGSEGAVVEVWDDGGCMVDFELEPIGDDPGYVQADLKPGQFKLIESS